MPIAIGMSLKPSPPVSDPRRFTHSGVVRVVLTYAAFAGLWILLSDRALDWLLHDTLQLTVAHTLKGWLFVAVTSMLLYGMLRRMVGKGAVAELPVLARRAWDLPFVLATAVIVLVFGLNIAHELKDQREMEVARLQALVDFKTQQIDAWLTERQADVEFVRTSTFFADLFRSWRDAGQAESGASLKSRLEQLRRYYGYQDLMLLERDGSVLWSSNEIEPRLSPALRAAADLTAHDRNIRRVGPYLDLNGRPRLDWVVPITKLGEPAPRLILRSDLADSLFAMLRAWPGPSVTGELMLLRRDGEDLVYLSPLRQPSPTAADLRVPLTAQTLLPARVLRGEALGGDVVSGRDYRGVSVVGVVRPVPGTEWYLLAKLDQSELYGGALGDAVWIALAGLLVVFLTGAGIVMWRQRERLAVAEIIHQSQADRLRALQLLGAIADGSDDAIFAKDLEGRYILFNPAASRIVGKPFEAVLGQDDRAIFPAEQAEMLMAFGRRVIAENRVDTMEEVLETAIGMRVFLATKGPLRDADGRVIGVFGISRDITALKRTEQDLRDSEGRLRLAQTSANVGIWDWDICNGKLNWTAELERLYGYAEGAFPGTYAAFRERVHPDDVAEVERVRDHAVAAHQGFDFDFRIQLPSSVIRWVNCKGAATYDGMGRPQRLSGVNVDITERRQAEEALQQQTAELKSRNAELERFNRATVGRELDMIELKKQVNALSAELGREEPYPLAFLDTPGSATAVDKSP